MAKTLEKPAVLAATIAAAASIGVALAGAIEGSISAYFQRQSATQKLRNQLVISIISHDYSTQTAYANVLIQSGVLPDEDGGICRAFRHDKNEKCPLKVLKSD